MKKKEHDELMIFKCLLEKTAPGDFDGHTDFQHMTPEERLFWLSQCAHFVSVVKSSGDESGS